MPKKKISLLLCAFAISVYADVLADIDSIPIFPYSEKIYPIGCKRKGNLVKCLIKGFNAGVIYDLNNDLMYEYYPRSEKQTEMAAVSKCESIISVLSKRWLENVNHADYSNFMLYRAAGLRTGEFEFVCENPIPVKQFFCQDDKRHLLVVKFDDLGIEDEQIHTTTNNPRFCKEKFDKKFK